MERFLAHRTALDGEDRAVVSAGPRLEAALEERDDRRLAAADGAHEKENALSHFEALRGGLEILDDLLDRLLDAVEVVGKETIAAQLVARVLVDLVDACGEDHFRDASV